MSRRVVLTAIVLAAGIWLLLPTTRVANGPAVGQLFWHDGEAILVLQHRLSGWHMSRVKVAISSLGAFGVPSQDFRIPVDVIRIAPSSVERYRFDKYDRVLELVVINNQLHSGLERWTGNHFEPDRLKDAPAIFKHGFPHDFADVEGWSKRSFVTGDDREPVQNIDFRLGVVSARLVSSWQDGVVAVDLDRLDSRPTERLWSADSRPKRVSATEYNALFRK